MPVQETKGLTGLKGWTQLTSEEQAAWLELHPKYKGLNTKQMISGYANQNFVDEFGRENFDKYDRQTRDSLYRSKVIDTATRDTFKDDDNFDTIMGLSDEGKLELFESDYLGKQEKVDTRREKLDEDKFLKNDGFEISDILDPFGIGRATARKAGEFQANITEKSKDNILADINAKDLYRKKDSVSERQFQLGAAYKAGLESGRISEDDVTEAFNKIVGGETETISSNLGTVTYENPGSRVYKAYKDSHEMADFGLQDMVDTIAEYQAMKESYGTQTALQYLDTKMQNYIADHQNVGDWFGSATQGIATKFAANVAGIPMFLESMRIATFEGNDALANWIEGKDKNGEDLPAWKNPQYWNGVDQFGSFSPEFINKVKEEYGGISKYNWLTPVGQEMSFASTMNEAVKMAGYMAAGALVSRGLGAGFKGVGALAKTAGSEAAKKAIEAAAPYAIGAINAMGISEAYALGTYDQVLQEANEKIDNKRYADAKEYAERTIQTSGETQGMLDEYVRARSEELLQQHPDWKLEDINQDALYEEGMLQYNAALQQQYLDEHDADYEADREMAKRAGATAYLTDALLEEARMSLSNLTYRKWMMSKADRKTIMEQFPNRKAVDTAKGLVGKTANGRSMEWGNITPVLRNIWGGARDNYLDDVTVAFAKGLALNKFNNYYESELSPQEYAASTDWLTEAVSGIVAGAHDAELSMIDKQSFHDGLVGGLGGAVTIAPRIGNIIKRSTYGDYANYDHSDIIRAASERGLSLDMYLNSKDLVNTDIKDGKVRKMSRAEIVGEYVFNPLLQDYSDAAQRTRDFQYSIDVANRVIANNVPKLNKIVTSGALMNEAIAAEKNQSLADLKDIQAKQAFSYVADLEDMMNDPIYSQSIQVQQQDADIKRIADGNITEQDVTNFLNDLDNKSVKEGQNAVQVATERLQKNAQQLIKMREAYRDAMEVVKNSPDFQTISYYNKANAVATQLAFNKVIYANRQERLSNMEKELRNSSVVSEISSPIALYGSESGRQSIEKYQQRVVDEQTAEVKSEEQKLKELENRKPSKAGRESYEHILQAQRLSLQESKRRLADSKAKLQDIQSAKDTDFSRVLSEDEIMALNPIERAEMLNTKAKATYSPAQKKIIYKLISNLVMRNPALLETIQDSAILTQRNEDVVTSNSIMQDNLIAAASYYEYAEQARSRGVQEVWKQKLRDSIDSVLESIPLSHPNILMREAKKFSPSVLSDYINRHPDSKDALTATLDIVKLREDAKGIIDRLYDGDMAKLNSMKNTVDSIIRSPKSKSVKDIMSTLEDAVEAHKGTPQESDWETFLIKLQEAKYTRDATKVQHRANVREAERKLAEAQKAKQEVQPKEENLEQSGKGIQIFGEKQSSQNSDTAEQTGEGILLFKGDKAQQTLTGEKGFTEDGSINEPTEQEIVDMASKDKSVTVIKPTEVEPEDIANRQLLDGVMIGNTLYEYEGRGFINSGLIYNGFANKNLRIAERKTPRSENALSAFYKWEDATHTDVQSIIDNELGEIVRKNPDTTIHFINYKNGSIKGIDSVIFNAVEYTDSIKKIHNEDLGGVITVNDKQYLIVGTLGYNPSYTEMQDSFNMIKNGIIADNNAADGEYYVSPNYTTKIDSIYAGYIVDNYGKEGAGQLRTLKSLLSDKKTNPHGITYNNAMFGIMHTKDGFVLYRQGKPGRTVYGPKSVDNSAGVVFLMVPSSNGNYIPIALEPAHVGDLVADSPLRRAIQDSVLKLTSDDKGLREEGLKELSDYLVFTKGVQEVKFSDGSHTNITLIRNDGAVTLTFDINDPNTRQTLAYEILQATPFRVNVTPKTLQTPNEIKIYDDSGALKTTAAKLGTVNASYTVLLVDHNGKPVEKAPIATSTPETVKPEVSGTRVSYDGNDYTIIGKKVYNIDGKPLNERSAFAVRAYNYIVTQNLSPEHTSPAGDRYYRISPQVVVFMDKDGKVWQIKGDHLEKYNIRLEQEKKDSLAKQVVEENGNLDGKKLSVVSENTDKSYNFTQEMRNARSLTYQAVGEFLTKKGIKDVKGLTIRQMKEELTKYKVSLDTVTDEKSFIDMLNNCL